MPPNCSLDDIDLSALKVSEIVRRALAKADYRYKRKEFLAIECEMKSFEFHSPSKQ